MDSPQELISAYLDGDLTGAQAEALERWINASDENAAEFVRLSFENQGLRTLLVADQSAQLLSLGDADGALGEEELDADDSDIMGEVVAAALAERRRHELEDEANRRLAEQQAKEAHDQRYLLRRNAPPPKEIVIPKPVLWLGLAALIGLVAWLGWPDNDAGSTTSRTADSGESDLPATRIRNNIAMIQNSVDARWVPGSEVDSQYLRDGQTLTLRSGLAQLVFGDGTTVIVQGPATFEPTGPAGLRLVEGRLTVSAPPSASGFRVETAALAVTQSGADFGVMVDRHAVTQAVALAGEITVQRNDAVGNPVGSATRVSSGSGVSATADSYGVIRSRGLAFVGAGEFDSRAAGAAGDPYARWLAYGYELRRDPSVVAYYTFDQADAERGVLANRAAGEGGGLDGRLGNGAEVAAPRWAPGRFEQTRSLRFGDAGSGRTYGVVVPDRDGLDLDGEMTFALWVRPANPNRFHGTLLSKRDVPPRRMNYQFAVMSDWHRGGNEMQFGAGEDLTTSPGFVYSPASGRLDSGGWVHLALTTDGRTVRYYINGERVHSARQPLPALTNGADLLIGTSAAGGGQHHFDTPVPFLGDISEVLIADRAFSAQDIQALYHNSRAAP